MQVTSWAVVITVAFHGALAVTIATLPDEKPTSPTVITVREVKREKPPPPPPPPPPPVIDAPATPAPAPPRPRPPAPKAKAPPPPPAPAVQAIPASAAPANLGLTMGNATGGDGPAVAARPSAAAPPPPPPARKTLEAAPVQATACSDPIVKPKPINVVQPAFTQEARDAGITGKVRVEITISAAGAVTSAKIIAGLGHGLDEAALEAARASTFSPATRCGESVETTFTIGMRFQ